MTDFEFSLKRGNEYKRSVAWWMFKKGILIPPLFQLRLDYVVKSIQNPTYQEAFQPGQISTLGQCLSHPFGTKVFICLPNIWRANFTKRHKSWEELEEAIIEDVCFTVTHEYLHAAIFEVYGEHPENIIRIMTDDKPEPPEVNQHAK